jgi:hypothetical protein
LQCGRRCSNRTSVCPTVPLLVEYQSSHELEGSILCM